ncbi:uncharacterized protein LOC122012449 [Zingiber officinale]|uniref:uncharacterized protein LOC122012449 n=1 Tax=Zingiber officinale TaxID=94328 RepID=UPI001C4B758B|nr:uncharacterized protein LOC122012449 [Zingiber officinale]
MKKLGNGKGRKVHPAPAQQDHLAALPAAVMALAATLTPGEQEVLAYLLSGGGRWREQRRRRPHPPELGCDCFGCYKSFWARWDASPNRHVIHRIIDAVEETLESKERVRGRRRRQRERKGCGFVAADGEESLELEAKLFPGADGGHLAGDNITDGLGDEGCVHGDGDDEEEEGEEIEGKQEVEEERLEDEEEQDNDENNSHESKSSMRRFMSFLGESVWGVWS